MSPGGPLLSRCRRLVRLAIPIVFFPATLLGAFAWAQAPTSLEESNRRIRQEFPDVTVISPRALARLSRNPAAGAPRLLDARTAEEFAVSHLATAVRVDPDAPALGEIPRAPGRLTVVYCSVGYRSARIARLLQRAGHVGVRNLEGGIFAWVREGRPVVRGRTRVRDVHPYDAQWAILLRPDYRTYRPRD